MDIFQKIRIATLTVTLRAASWLFLFVCLPYGQLVSAGTLAFSAGSYSVAENASNLTISQVPGSPTDPWVPVPNRLRGVRSPTKHDNMWPGVTAGSKHESDDAVQCDCRPTGALALVEKRQGT